MIGVDLDDLDITRARDVQQLVRGLGPAVMINCAAFNAVDEAERRPLEAMRCNGEAVWTLASLAEELGAVLVHYSSDFVFDGSSEAPCTEHDTTGPLSVYGMSKLAGEWAAARASRHYILRLSSLYGGHTRRSFVDRIVALAAADCPVAVFTDRTVSPSYVPDVVGATLALVDGRKPFGLYHCVSGGWCTWSEFGHRALARLGKPHLLEPVSSPASASGARRPARCALSNEKLGRAGVPLRHWSEALDHYLTLISDADRTPCE